MKRILVSVLLLFVLAAVISAQQAEGSKPTITVLDFSTESVSQSEMKTIISLLSSSLFQMNMFTVIDVSQRENILNEIRFSASGCTDESCMLEIGRLLAAEMIVVGSLSKIGSRYVLSCKLLETQTGKTLGTGDGIYANLDAMVDDLLNFGGKLVSAIRPAGAPVTAAAQPAAPAPQPAEPSAGTGRPAKEPRPPREPVAVNWKKVGGISLVSLGAIAAGVGGYLIYDVLGPMAEDIAAAWDEYDNATADFDSLYDVYTGLLELRKSYFIYGLSAAGGGLALATAGTILLLIPNKEAPVEVSAMIVPAPKRLGAFVSIRF